MIIAEDHKKADRQCVSIGSLTLTDFRCYSRVRLSLKSSENLIVLLGPNGAGKTNVLEAISYLAPGRGLRNAVLGDVGRITSAPIGSDLSGSASTGPAPWAVSGVLLIDDEEIRVGSGYGHEAGDTRRSIRLDGETQTSSAVFGQRWTINWLTPQMDRLFLEGPSSRRRFLDRMVLGLYPDHSRQVAAFERIMRDRNRLLGDHGMQADGSWLNALEAKMAEHAVAVAAARLDYAGQLAWQVEKGETPGFPSVSLAIDGELEAALQAGTAPVEVEAAYRDALKAMRQQDCQNGRTARGPHKSDLVVTHQDKNMRAELCSTGEQKALLISLILANALLVSAIKGHGPILLLDEVAAHLDENRRKALFDILLGLGSQCWLTGTDQAMFSALDARASFFKVQDNMILPMT